jgi:hypothetical protein
MSIFIIPAISFMQSYTSLPLPLAAGWYASCLQRHAKEDAKKGAIQAYGGKETSSKSEAEEGVSKAPPRIYKSAKGRKVLGI